VSHVQNHVSSYENRSHCQISLVCQQAPCRQVARIRVPERLGEERLRIWDEMDTVSKARSESTRKQTKAATSTHSYSRSFTDVWENYEKLTQRSWEVHWQSNLGGNSTFCIPHPLSVCCTLRINYFSQVLTSTNSWFQALDCCQLGDEVGKKELQLCCRHRIRGLLQCTIRPYGSTVVLSVFYCG
jgi:hypothetical protein